MKNVVCWLAQAYCAAYRNSIKLMAVALTLFAVCSVALADGAPDPSTLTSTVTTAFVAVAGVVMTILGFRVVYNVVKRWLSKG